MQGRTQRRLAAIVAADVAGYSRLMGVDEAGTLAALRGHREELIDPAIEEYGGRIVKTMGDGLLLEFPSVVDAVQCAIQVQTAMAERNGHIPEDRRIVFRIGINLGDIIIDGDDIHGDGINIAARLEGLAEPGGICISRRVYEDVQDRLDVTFTDAGERELKNIARPVHVWRWSVEGEASTADVDVSKPVSGFDGRPAIAVLPFENMSGDPEQEYFADGIAEDILTRLAMWRWLPVIARNSTFAFKGQNVDITDVGRQLGARYVLEGSVRKAGSRVRITGQLIDAETGHHLWADRYDGNLDDIFDLQDEITDAIVAALEPAVGQAETRRAHQLTSEHLGTWDVTQRAAWHFYKFTKEDFDLALNLLRPVINDDLDFAHAASYASIIRLMQAWFAWTDNPPGALMESAQFAITATTVDAMDPMANAMSGFALTFQGQHAAGITATRHAIELNPSSALAYHVLGTIYLFDGQPQEAKRAINQALRLSPFDSLRPVWLATLSASHYQAQEYEQALEIAKNAVSIAPHYVLALRGRANALAQLGRMEEAREALDAFLAVSPNYTVASGRAGVAFRDEAVFQHYMDGLRKAGLPEA